MADRPKAEATTSNGLLLRALTRIADAGNRLPDPVTLFVMLTNCFIDGFEKKETPAVCLDCRGLNSCYSTCVSPTAFPYSLTHLSCNNNNTYS